MLSHKNFTMYVLIFNYRSKVVAIPQDWTELQSNWLILIRGCPYIAFVWAPASSVPEAINHPGWLCSPLIHENKSSRSKLEVIDLYKT